MLFTNTCPFTINYLSANGGIPAGTTNIVAGCYVAEAPTTTFASTNLASSGVSSSLQTCRVYNSQIQVEPSKATPYVDNNKNKEVAYCTILSDTILSNHYNNQNGNFNQLINSVVGHPIGT